MSNLRFLPPSVLVDSRMGNELFRSRGLRGDLDMPDAAARERAVAAIDSRCRILLISSPKGGSGKSVLSRHLLVSAAQAGVRVLGLDFDRQQTLAKWAARRARTREAFPDFAEAVVEPVTLQDWRTALRRSEDYRL